jgi:predicted flap endonuclease-1-like 5' DNA nuclease
MDANQQTVLLIVGVLAILFLIALFYILRLEGKKQKTTTSKVTEPQAATIVTPKKAEAVVAPESKPQATAIETIKKAEPIVMTQVTKPQAATIVTPKKAEAVVAPEPKPQAATIVTPKKAEPSLLEDVKIKPTESQTIRKSKVAPKAKSRRARTGIRIIEVEGIGPTYAEKLNSNNIFTTSDLLESGATPRGRKELADKTGISPNLILEWVNRCDLFRIKGVGEEYSDLLEEAGVDTVVELSRRNAANLHAKILEVNEAKKLVRRPPSLVSVERWIKESKDLPRIIEY